MTEQHAGYTRSSERPLPGERVNPGAKANGKATEAPAGDAAAQEHEFLAFWHGDIDLANSRPWTVHGTIPEVGAGLLSGQWGTYKTFVAIDLGCAVMSGTPIFGSDIDRRGGVLLYAAEGEHEVPIRLQASIDSRCPELTKAAPFA
jgi:AAA domain